MVKPLARRDRRAACLLSLSLSLAACRRPAPRDASVDASRLADATASHDVALARRTRFDAGARDAVVFSIDGSAPETEAADVIAGVARVVRARAGAVVVWTLPSGDDTALVAQRLDADGVRVGTARRLGVARGHVVAMDADARHGVLWIAWVSDRGSQGRWQLRASGMLTASDDLSSARPVVTLSDLRVWPIARRWTRLFAEVRAGDDGTATMLASGDNVPCPLSQVPVAGRLNWVDCAGWQWFRVRVDGRVTAEGRGGVARPEMGPASLTWARGGWAYARGPLDAVSTSRVVLDPAGYRTLLSGGTTSRLLPAFLDTISTCGDPRVAWTGDAFVVRCTPDASLGEPEGTTWVRVVRDDGTAATTARNTVARLNGEVLRCVDGRPVVELRWERGFVRLDPSRDDASLRIERWDTGGVLHDVDAAAWAGRALVGVNAARGRISRWVCDERGELAAVE